MTGETILHYRIEGQIGKGGMGVVFRGTDLKLLRPVALKFIPEDISTDSSATERFLREARAASQIDHPNVGTIYGVETAPNGRQFIAMAYYDGQTLTELLSGPLLPVGRALSLTRQIAQGLGEAHRHGIVHRDIKPSNVILTSQGLAKIVDFGLASLSGSDRLTQTGARMGTPHYMSPEQALGQEVDHRTDLWSLGVLLYEMLTGALPVQAPSIPAALYRTVHEQPNLDAVDISLRPIVARALAKDPEHRYQSAEELIVDLETALPTSPTATAHSMNSTMLLPEHTPLPRPAGSSAPAPPAGRRKAALAGIAAIALASLGYGGYRLFFSKPSAAQKALESAHPSAHQDYLKALDLLDRWEKGDNLATSTQLLENAVKTDPTFALAHARLAEAYRIRGTSRKDPAALTKALASAERAAQLSPDLPPVQTVLGRVYSALGKNDLALAALTRALQLDANDPDANMAMGRQYEKGGRLNDAEQAYLKGVSLQPDSWRNQFITGQFYYRQRKFPEAISYWQRVTELTPDNGPAQTNLGAALLEAGRLPEAQATYQRAISLKPNYVDYMNLGKVHYLQGHYPQAAEMFSKAAGLNAEDYIPVGNLAAALSWIPGKKDQSSEEFRRAAKMAESASARSKTEPEIFCDLAIYYAKLAQPELSKRRIQTALALAPSNNAVYAAAAEASAILNRRDDAVQLAARALELGYPYLSFRRNPELAAVMSDPRLKPAQR